MGLSTTLGHTRDTGCSRLSSRLGLVAGGLVVGALWGKEGGVSRGLLGYLVLVSHIKHLAGGLRPLVLLRSY